MTLKKAFLTTFSDLFEPMLDHVCGLVAPNDSNEVSKPCERPYETAFSAGEESLKRKGGFLPKYPEKDVPNCGFFPEKTAFQTPLDHILKMKSKVCRMAPNQKNVTYHTSKWS